MKSCYIKETDYASRLQIFRFTHFKSEKLVKENIKREGRMTIIHIPKIHTKKPAKIRKYYNKWCYILKMMGIKYFCAGNIENELLKYYLRNAFSEIRGEAVLRNHFDEIISYFAKKKGFSLSECEIVLISDQPTVCRGYFEKVIRKVRKITVYTNKEALFSDLSEELRKEYGVHLSIKGKEQKPKYFRRLYVNLEEDYLFPRSFFQQIPILDIYQTYQNSYHKILFEYKTEMENVINTYKIAKNLTFTAYLEEIMKETQQKNYKITNIAKL